MGSATQEAFAVFHAISLEWAEGIPPTIGGNSSGIGVINPVVVKTGKPQSEAPGITANSDHNHDRCKCKGLRSSYEQAIDPRHLGQSVDQPLIQRQGAKSSDGSNVVLQPNHKGEACKNILRQHHSSQLHKKTRRNKDSKPHEHCRRDLDLGRKKSSILSGSLPKGRTKHSSRFSKQRNIAQNRMVSKPNHIQSSHSNMRKSQIDLFATRKNRKVETFFSLQRDPLSLSLDTLSQLWVTGLVYPSLPFTLIPKIIKKICFSSARVILIAPYWPKRTWFRGLIKLSIAKPWNLPCTPYLIYQGAANHPSVGQFSLMAWLLKGSS